MPSANAIKKYAYIDAVRGIAASGVILHHTPRAYLSDHINSFLTLGAGGVPLFFILSAFTLFLSFERRSATESHPTRNFFIRRFFRIAPLLYLLIPYFLFQDGFTARNPDDPNSVIDLNTIIATLTFTFGFHPYWINAIVPSSWSVATEMIFYLVLPVLFLWVNNLKRALWFLIFAILSSKIMCFFVAHYLSGHLSHTMVDSKFWTAFMYMYFPAQLPIFALGILLYFLIKAKQNSAGIQPSKGLAIPILILCLLLLIGNGLRSFSTDGLIPKFVTDAALLFLSFIFALYLFPAKLFVNKATVYLGKISYSLYLTHGIAVYWVSHLIPEYFLGNGFANYLFHFCIIFLFTIPVASLTYYCIEKPGIRLGHMLITRLEFSQKETGMEKLSSGQV